MCSSRKAEPIRFPGTKKSIHFSYSHYYDAVLLHWGRNSGFLFPDINVHAAFSVVVGGLLGALLVLIDILLKGFSLRALSRLTFGLRMGALASHFVTISPLFDGG